MAGMNESAQGTPWETLGGPQPTSRAHHGLEERGSRSSGRRSGRRRLSRSVGSDRFSASTTLSRTPPAVGVLDPKEHKQFLPSRYTAGMAKVPPSSRLDPPSAPGSQRPPTPLRTYRARATEHGAVTTDFANDCLLSRNSPHGVRTFLSISTPITEVNLERKHGELSLAARSSPAVSNQPLHAPELVLVEQPAAGWNHCASSDSRLRCRKR